MTDEQRPEEVHPSDYLADIALRLVERDLFAGESWRVAYAIAGILDQLSDASKGDTPEVSEFAEELIVDTVNTLLYAHIHVLPTEQDIDTQAKQFSDLFDRAEEFRKNKNEEDH